MNDGGARIAMVFGATGQDGAYLCNFLLEKGYRVIAVVRALKADCGLVVLGLDQQIEIIQAKVFDEPFVSSVIRNYKPDEVYNLVGQSSVSLSYELSVETITSNVTFAAVLLSAVEKYSVQTKLFCAGSVECFRGGVEPITESTAFDPKNPYGIAKTAAAQLARVYRERRGFLCRLDFCLM